MWKQKLLCALGLLSALQTTAGPVSGSSAREPPRLRELPPLSVPQNSSARRILDLWRFLEDADTPAEQILLSLNTPPRLRDQGHAGVTLSDNRYVDVSPTENWTGRERVVVEANDGVSVSYATLTVTVISSQAGNLIEAEDDGLVDRRGAWVQLYHEGQDYLYSDRPGDSLSVEFEGSAVAVSLWHGDLVAMQRYYEGNYDNDRYGFLADWKTYRQGAVSVRIDGSERLTVDLAAEESPGWTERLVVEGLEPTRHSLELIVESGYVSVDRIRVSDSPLLPLTASVTDEYGTPLADVTLTFSRPRRPDILLRTNRHGSVPRTYALQPGTYDLAVAADSNPGYYRPPDPEENLLPERVEGLVIGPGETHLRPVLRYAHPDDRSLGMLRRPLGTVPVIVRAGLTFDIQCLIDGPPATIEASLGNSLHERDLVVESVEAVVMVAGNGQRQSGLRVLARVPETTPEGLYDLAIRLDGRRDEAPRAVKVVREIGRPYRFAHLSDTHIRSPRGNSEHAERLRQIASEINALQPAFAVITGDLTDSGSRPEYLRLLRALGDFEVPTYLIPGNHDHYSWWTRYLYQGGDEYDRYIGPRFYDFNYADDTYVMVDPADYEKVYEREVPGFRAAQWPGLVDQLQHTKRPPGGLLAVLSHYDYTSVLPRRFAVAHQLEDLLTASGVDLYLHGHRHSSAEGTLAGGTTRVLATGSTINGEYRLVEVNADGEVASRRMEAGQLEVTYDGANDGSAQGMTAIVVNSREIGSESVLLRFRLRWRERGYRVEGGEVRATLSSDDGSQVLLTVSVEVPATTTRRVEVIPE